MFILFVLLFQIKIDKNKQNKYGVLQKKKKKKKKNL